MQYKLKYYDRVYCFAGIASIKQEVFYRKHLETYSEAYWENGHNWFPEPDDIFLKDQVFKSKLLRTLFL